MTTLIDTARVPILFARAIIAGIVTALEHTNFADIDDDVTIVRGPECEVIA